MSILCHRYKSQMHSNGIRTVTPRWNMNDFSDCRCRRAHLQFYSWKLTAAATMRPKNICSVLLLLHIVYEIRHMAHIVRWMWLIFGLDDRRNRANAIKLSAIIIAVSAVSNTCVANVPLNMHCMNEWNHSEVSVIRATFWLSMDAMNEMRSLRV